MMYRHGGATHVLGHDALASSEIQLRSGASDAFGFAPGVEFSWKPTIGVLVAARVIPTGHNTTSSITPAIAINIVR
jgi:hypothetical protein